MGCFSSDKPKTTFELPGWVKGPSKAIGSGVTSALKTPFTPYTGDRTAGLSGTQNDAMAMFEKMFGSGDQIRVIDDIPGSGPAAGSTQDYMNPYLEQVLGPVLRQLSQANGDRMQSFDAERNMAGAYGDTGAALGERELQDSYLQAVGDQTGKISYDAYNNAMGLKGDDLARRDQMADYLKTLFNMGGVEQATGQRDLDADYEEFLRKIGFQWDSLAKAGAITGSLPTGTAVTTPGAPSGAAQALSGLSTAAAFLI